MDHVIEGRLNKQIAASLNIGVKTVKVHRGRVMSKMRVRSVAQLVHLCDAIVKPDATQTGRAMVA
jgi:FixJ family two-component response regulator